MIDIVRRAAERVGGVPALAERLGVSRQALYQWQRVPADKVGALARATDVPPAELRPDLYPDAPRPEPVDMDTDLAVWSEQQAGHLEAGRFDLLDIENLAEEIRDLGNRDRDEIESRLSVLLLHLLKWRFQPGQRSRSWQASILEQRGRIARRIKRSPSLRSYPASILPDEYDFARERAALETGLPLDRFPAACPFAVDDLLDRDFLPEAAGND